MGKKKIKIQCLLLLLIMLSNTQIFSQELFTKKLQWANQDSIEVLTFQSKNQITEWGKSFGEFAFVQPREFCINNSHILVLIVDCCSGLSCPYIYVFKEKGDIWELQTTSQARLTGILTVKIDNDQKKIIFEIRLGRKDNPVVEQIGELLF